MKLIKNKVYSAELKLNFMERIASNETVRQKFLDVGFKNVTVSGSGATRLVTGVWPLEDLDNAPIPKQVVRFL